MFGGVGRHGKAEDVESTLLLGDIMKNIKKNRYTPLAFGRKDIVYFGINSSEVRERDSWNAST